MNDYRFLYLNTLNTKSKDYSIVHRENNNIDENNNSTVKKIKNKNIKQKTW